MASISQGGNVRRREMNRIYALIDPRDGSCRYVGKTCKTLDFRLKQHIGDASRFPSGVPRFRWIVALAREGFSPKIQLLEECENDWQSAEIRWIRKFREAGINLLNCTDGGDGIVGHRLSAETRNRISESAKARYSDPEAREHLKEMLRLSSLPESRAKLSASLKASFAKPEVKERLCEAQRVSCSRPEVRAARSLALSGRVFTEEWKLRLSVAAKGRKMSAEARAKMSASRTGKTRSEETKAKQRAAALRRYHSEG